MTSVIVYRAARQDANLLPAQLLHHSLHQLPHPRFAYQPGLATQRRRNPGARHRLHWIDNWRTIHGHNNEFGI